MSRVAGAVILGAGFARRFGSDKRLHPLGDQTVARTTLTKFLSVFDHVRLVLRNDDTALRQHVEGLAIELVSTDEAHLGLGHSLRTGFQTLPWSFAFVGLLDMPFIATQTLSELRQTAADHEYASIVRPRYENSVRGRFQCAMTAAPWGHPIGFPQSLFDDFTNLQGDVGARAVLKQHSELIVEYPTQDEGVIKDIDRPSDLT